MSMTVEQKTFEYRISSASESLEWVMQRNPDLRKLLGEEVIQGLQVLSPDQYEIQLSAHLDSFIEKSRRTLNFTDILKKNPLLQERAARQKWALADSPQIPPNMGTRTVTPVNPRSEAPRIPAADTLIARPLKEFAAHVKNCRRVSWELFVRVIKVLVLAIFRGHFCDRVMLNDHSHLIYGFKDKVTREDHASFEKKYPYLLQSCFRLFLKSTAEEKGAISLMGKGFRSQDVINYYKQSCNIDITSKSIDNHVKDLLNSKAFICRSNSSC